ncbi:DNA-binding protein [Halalkalibaculum sp. DA384]|uniref:DNA-binding protein n=1 Tax=Halalkalibaculum sp. DA384 TaxID=3373606 RepID=UPI003754A2DF
MNKVIMSTVLSIVIMTVTLLSTAWSQQRPGKGMGQMYTRNYDVSTVETMKGEVVDISYNPSKKNAAVMGVHVVVKTDTESIPVHLGPVWYLNEQDQLNKGDKIEVTGSRITFNGAPALVAATVKRNEMTLQLRDQNGFPVWRGWRMSGMRNNQ